jgi:hypothetical protein
MTRRISGSSPLVHSAASMFDPGSRCATWRGRPPIGSWSSERRDEGTVDPDTMEAELPAHGGFIPVAHAAVAAASRSLGLDAAAVVALPAVAEEMATSLLERARPLARLTIVLTRDEEDVYLRMAVEPTATSRPPSADGLACLLLAGMVDSVDTGAEGGKAFGHAQRAIG